MHGLPPILFGSLHQFKRGRKRQTLRKTRRHRRRVRAIRQYAASRVQLVLADLVADDAADGSAADGTYSATAGKHGAANRADARASAGTRAGG